MSFCKHRCLIKPVSQPGSGSLCLCVQEGICALKGLRGVQECLCSLCSVNLAPHSKPEPSPRAP